MTAGAISITPVFSWVILALIVGLVGLVVWRNRKNKSKRKTAIIIGLIVFVGIAVLIAAQYTFSYAFTDYGYIGSLDWTDSSQVVASQAERDYAYERCARDMQNFDGLLCIKIKSGEVPIPPKYILSFTMSDEEILNEVRKLPEVLAFNEKYTPYEVFWREGTSAHVKYLVERLRSGGQDSPIKESEALHLLVKFDSIGRTSMEYQCGGEVTSNNVLDIIKNTECPD